MADAPLAKVAADHVHDVVRGLSLGLVDQ
jgi:hypothetical protein